MRAKTMRRSVIWEEYKIAISPAWNLVVLSIPESQQWNGDFQANYP
jgi:hypothetical protein